MAFLEELVDQPVVGEELIVQDSEPAWEVPVDQLAFLEELADQLEAGVELIKRDLLREHLEEFNSLECWYSNY